uniref:Remorin C-terminal domain-containing protein n=2 Tax=Oryza barthii TaxID=65489 RepID=A0A0D3H7N6_9ORYZ
MERMRCVGGGDTPLGFRGVVEEELEEEVAAVSASGRPMQRQRRRRRRWGEEADDGCSASSTGGGGSSGCGSFGCDSPLAGFVRADGDPDTDLETDGVATPSSNASAAFAEPHDEEEGDEVLCGVVEGDWAQLQEPTKSPADRATGECLYQRRRSEAVLLQGRKGLKQRPASLDFGSGSPGFNGAPLSPGFVVGGVGLMNKGLVSSSFIRSDVFPSPRTPNYRRHRSSVFGYQKGWSSERVPLASKGNRRYPGSSMAFPFSNGRTLPSKWEDAERWIFSPNSSDVLEKTSFAPARRPKSKSGPLGPPGKFGGQYSSVSLLDNGRVGHLTANSPFLAGVLIPEHYCGEKDNIGRYMSRTAGEEASIGTGGKSCLANGGSHATQYNRVRRRLDTAIESSPSLPSTQASVQDEQVGITEDSASIITPIILRKDAATQTSPNLSRSSSPSVSTPFIHLLTTHQVREKENCFSDVIRDVHMDDRVTLTRWSKKHVTRASSKNSTNVIDVKKKTVESKSSSWELTEAKSISKVEREQEKITAWEHLQKAKAEAAIQKLVMKIEKKRSSSLDKIWNTLRSAQRRAQVMRETAAANQDEQSSGKAKRTSHLNKNGQISSLSGCFTCHAFYCNWENYGTGLKVILRVINMLVLT